ncbi:MAG: hypothetical protein KIT02_10265 [Devosia sp.]|uniref:hypothetical protein n=1 Tax=Devosia sp. TaxID=1871048 RepID=UPI0024C70279|nr:hypothetical protein [Devosia sp.]UYN98350.1 MAG: hypothetical protein KIT02_10265 [Devosia sp.]
MSKGYQIGGGEMRVWDDGRNAMISAGAMLGFLPSEESYSFNAAFPDVPKGRIDLWDWECDFNSLAPEDQRYLWGTTGIAAVGARPQEWVDTITLTAAPSGANLFFGRVRVNRSSGPSHSWLGQTLSAAPFANLWVPAGGSMELEAATGFSRGLSIYITGGNLVARLDQSVSGQCGGFRSWGDSNPQSLADSKGGQNRYGGSGSTAQPVWFPTSSPGRKVSSGTTGILVGPGAPQYQRHKWDGTDPPTYSDPTDYSATYAVEVVGRFGRHA